jgi:hypothetical protein
MKKINRISKELVAPCGMNCALCSRYLAYANNLKRSRCIGCRPSKKNCGAVLKNKCTGTKNISKGNIPFCFECSQYPCKSLHHLDDRYRKNYGMSMIDNLEFIKMNGIGQFIKSQYAKHHCPKCSHLISVHNNKCFRCDKITKLVDKNASRADGRGTGTRSRQRVIE